MAAISDDTAALVAAQLTVAWATRTGVKPARSDPAEGEVLRMYMRYHAAVKERTIKHVAPPAI